MANDMQPLKLKVPAHISRLSRDVLDTGVLNTGREYPVISIKGRRFATIGTDGQVTELSGDYIDVIFVDGSPGVGRRFFENAYDPQNPEPPSCWSEDGREPAAEVKLPQAASCTVCPLAEKGSGKQSRGSACAMTKALILYFADDPDRTLYRLSVSSLSIFAPTEGKPGYLPWMGTKSNIGYTKYLRENGIAHFSAAVTRVAFARADVPHIGFKAVGFVDESDVAFLNGLKPDSYDNMLKIVSVAEQNEAPAARSRAAAPAKARQVEDAEEAPPARSRAAAPAKARQVEDAEEAPPVRSRAAAPAKARQVEDAEEAPPVRSRAVPSKLQAQTIEEEEDAGDDSDELTRQLLAMGQ